MPLADRVAALATKLKVTALDFETTLTMMDRPVGLEIEIMVSTERDQSGVA